jgi:hypothetical protein
MKILDVGQAFSLAGDSGQTKHPVGVQGLSYTEEA